MTTPTPQAFDPGYGEDPWRGLAAAYPGTDVYPAADFRVEWGPIFHRGRLDGSARLLVIGQDPAEHEAIARRILIGEAGQRVQGFLAKLGLTTSYVMVNTYLYSVYGQTAGNAHVHDAAIAAYRNSWLDALVLGQSVQAVVAFGTLADTAYHAWAATQPAAAAALAYQHVMHPTAPISGSGGDPVKYAELTKVDAGRMEHRPAGAARRRHARRHPRVAVSVERHAAALRRRRDSRGRPARRRAGLDAVARELGHPHRVVVRREAGHDRGRRPDRPAPVVVTGRR